MENKKIVWLTLKQGAAHAGLGLKAFKNAVYRLALPSYKPTRTKHRMVKENEVDAWMESGRAKVSAKRMERLSGAAS